jgi:release factor glutamine methyltransferase
MRVIVFPGVLRPPSDSALLGGVLARHAGEITGRAVLDLCAGTGILGLTAARLGAHATAVDISRRAVACARLNARLNRLALEVLRGDLFEPLRGRRFDFIVSNPPYIPAPPGGTPRGAARAWDAGPDGRVFIDRICDRAAEHLRPGGRVLLVQSSLARPEETERRLAERGFDSAIVAEHAGRLGPVAHGRLDYLRALGVAGTSLAERMAVIEGRLATPAFAPAAGARLQLRELPAARGAP